MKRAISIGLLPFLLLLGTFCFSFSAVHAPSPPAKKGTTVANAQQKRQQKRLQRLEKRLSHTCNKAQKRRLKRRIQQLRQEQSTGDSLSLSAFIVSLVSVGLTIAMRIVLPLFYSQLSLVSFIFYHLLAILFFVIVATVSIVGIVLAIGALSSAQSSDNPTKTITYAWIALGLGVLTLIASIVILVLYFSFAL